MTKERGSEKLLAQLFGGQDASPEALSRAVGEVRAAGFIIDSWWWRGQPRIEAISAKLRVDRNSLGTMVEQLAGLHSAEQQVSLEVCTGWNTCRAS